MTRVSPCCAGPPLPAFAMPPGMQIPGVSGAMAGGPGGFDPSAMFGGVHGFPPQWPPLAGSGFIPPPVSNDGCASTHPPSSSVSSGDCANSHPGVLLFASTGS